MSWIKAKRLLAGLAFAGIPLITTASCDPVHGTLEVYRNDDYHDHGIFDVVGDWFYDGCFFWDDCYYHDDYYYEEIVIWD
ncbi:MAG: hypothetical protein JSU86_12430 [Phycisphaerales bacterium]|nr:MAG: hypothetical protein JSU86_12430 [Phycisphaerales bacterium]